MSARGAGGGGLSLGLANAIALLAAVAAAALYAGRLAPPEFAAWTGALALGRAALLLLDGGLKTALVRRADWPAPATLRRLRRLCFGLAIGLLAAGAAAALVAWSAARVPAGAVLLYLLYAAAYLLPYPPLFAALARLERARSFGAVGRAEGLSVALEFALPALLMAAGAAWWLAFALAVSLARAVRSAWIIAAARALGPDSAGTGEPAALLREGAGVQAIAALSMVRDQMHLWLVVPWFGAAWGGQYGFAFTACALATQALVQTASRVALPALREADADTRWRLVVERSALLALAVLPPLALLPAWLARADGLFWDGRWAPAVALLPWIALRMVCSVGTTIVGAWLLVAQPPWAAARAHAAWTAAEVAVAVSGLAVFGPTGLAIGCAVSVWVGLGLFVAAAAPGHPIGSRLRELVRALVVHPSIGLALLLAAWVHAVPSALAAASVLLPLVWLTEPALRRALRPRPLRHDPA